MSTTTQPAATAPPPSGPRRGGRRGGGGGARGGKTTGGGGGAINAAAAQPDDTEEVRKLRTKYADKLALLRELFPSWTDEDLLFALQEAGGEMELAVGRISEGHAEQFSSVKSKKQAKKETGSVATPITFQGAAAPAASGAAAAGSGSRGGRGGVVGATREGRGGASTRGARGGRGGLRGSAVGRGGSAAPKVDGKSVPDTTVTSSGNAGDAKASATWADALAATSKSNGTAGASWGDDTDGLDLNTTAQGTTGTSTKATDSETASKGMAAPAETSSQQEEPGMVASALAKILPSKLVPKGSKMSWAQVARPADPPKPVISEPTLISVNSAPAATKEATTVAHKVETSKAPAPPIKSDVVAESPSAPIAAPAVQEAKPLEATSAATVTAPPGLNNEDATAPAPAPVAEASTEIAAGSTAGEKPSMPRSAQSQRALQRAKQQEAVVMAGNNAQYDNLGVRFGSLNFLGGEDNDAQTEDPTTAAAPAPAPATAAPEGGAYSDRFSQAAQPVQPSTTASGPTHVQQQTQTVPTHQDAFTQATSSPSQFNASKPEAVNAHQYGYQQGLAQHQQAHQAAVAQTQQQSQQHQQGPQQASSAISQLDQQSAYSQTGAGNASGGFGAPHSAQAQQQAGSQYGEYYGGLDSQRMSSFYGNYDQQGGLSARGNDDRNAHAQTAGVGAPNEGQQQPHHAPQGTPQQQQQFPNVMPYYYPHYYLPNQFQHYGQPGGGYGQYALYGQQPQHPSKPAAPAATVQSPYSQQNGPADLNANAPYGSSAAGQYNQSPAASSALAGSGSGYVDGGFGRQAGNASANDYSKLYGSTATPGSTHSSSIPGLGGFLGQSPAGGANGGTPQMKNGPSHALENAYRQYDNGKVNSASSGPAQQQQQSQQQGQQRAQLPQSSGQPGQGQQQPQQGQGQAQQQQQQQQQQPGVTPQQQQQYYQQYNAYAGLQPSAATGSYGNYPYRQYWG